MNKFATVALGAFLFAATPLQIMAQENSNPFLQP